MSHRKARRGVAAVTLRQVAEVARVSPMTVSRVIGGLPSVDAELRRRVEDAIAQTGYRLNAAARGLARGESVRIGVLHGNPSASFTSQMLVGLLENSSSLGCQLVLERCLDLTSALKAAKALIAARPGGVIVSTPFCDMPSVIEAFDAAKILTIALGTGNPEHAGLAVRIDNYTAAYAMTNHLLSQGHRTIGFIQGHAKQIDSDQRQAGFVAAMAQAGIKVDEAWIMTGDYTYRSGVAAAEQLLRLNPRPTAIFASNDDMAAGALATAHRHRLDVPEELSIAGFDDTPLATTVWPTLTTIRQPIEAMAARGIRLLLDTIQKTRPGEPPVIVHDLVDLPLISRESVAPLDS